MLITCDGLNPADDADVDADAAAATDAEYADILADRVRAAKLALLELLLAAGVSSLFARADGSGDEGSIDELHCYVQVTDEQCEECAVPPRIEDLVQELLDAAEGDGAVNFNGDGGFWELTITTATRECVIECGWYYTTSESTTTTETL